jgi:transposase
VPVNGLMFAPVPVALFPVRLADGGDRAGATLHYPPDYSPDLNPIEQAFAKLKAALQKAAARTLDALIKSIAQALAEFASQECPITSRM